MDTNMNRSRNNLERYFYTHEHYLCQNAFIENNTVRALPF